VVILAVPDISLATLAVIAGLFLIVDGIFEIGNSLAIAGEHRWLLALLGIVTIVVGIVLMRHPFEAVAAVALLVGIWLIVHGVIRFIRVLAEPGQRSWAIFVAAVEVVAGIVIVSSPDIGVVTLAIFIGIAFILRGLLMCAIAMSLRTIRHEFAPAPPGSPGV
jgi:uncharacterized membrane protein HdeD (DUF308 family)